MDFLMAGISEWSIAPKSQATCSASGSPDSNPWFGGSNWIQNTSSHWMMKTIWPYMWPYSMLTTVPGQWCCFSRDISEEFFTLEISGMIGRSSKIIILCTLTTWEILNSSSAPNQLTYCTWIIRFAIQCSTSPLNKQPLRKFLNGYVKSEKDEYTSVWTTSERSNS